MIAVLDTASVQRTTTTTSTPIAVMTTGSETKILTSRHIGRRTSKAISRVTTVVHGNAGNRLVLRGAGGRSHAEKERRSSALRLFFLTEGFCYHTSQRSAAGRTIG